MGIRASGASCRPQSTPPRARGMLRVHLWWALFAAPDERQTEHHRRGCAPHATGTDEFRNSGPIQRRDTRRDPHG